MIVCLSQTQRSACIRCKDWFGFLGIGSTRCIPPPASHPFWQLGWTSRKCCRDFQRRTVDSFPQGPLARPLGVFKVVLGEPGLDHSTRWAFPRPTAKKAAAPSRALAQAIRAKCLPASAPPQGLANEGLKEAKMLRTDLSKVSSLPMLGEIFLIDTKHWLRCKGIFGPVNKSPADVDPRCFEAGGLWTSFEDTCSLSCWNPMHVL